MSASQLWIAIASMIFLLFGSVSINRAENTTEWVFAIVLAVMCLTGIALAWYQ